MSGRNSGMSSGANKRGRNSRGVAASATTAGNSSQQSRSRVPADSSETQSGSYQRSRTIRRIKLASGVAIIAALALIGRLAVVQLWWAPDLSALAQDQRTRVFVDPARRGAILDIDGNDLAYTMQARSLTISPIVLRKEMAERVKTEFAKKDLRFTADFSDLSEDDRKKINEKVEEEIRRYSVEIPQIIKSAGASTDDIKAEHLSEKFHADTDYEVLVRNVDPDVAQKIAEQFPGIAADLQNIRQYPNGKIGSSVIGKISQDGEGQFGFEASNDSKLAGIDGRTTVDVSLYGQAIPGTTRDEIPALNGATTKLTLDLDLQTYVQQAVEQAVEKSGAKSGEVVVLDAKTAKVMAMANSGTINPMGDIQKQLNEGKEFTNTSISNPFEPGSVAKVITAAGVIENGLSTPDEVLQVPGSIDMAGVTVRDAWEHGTVPYTTTGVFGKSSNVGTLMLADRLGEERYNDLLVKFGIGQTTGIELPNESAGLLPDLSQWSGGTFANLPIGQGMSWTLLQMASVYQTLANDGVRIQPRIVEEMTDSSGNPIPQDAPEKVQVVSPQTARTVVDMFQAVTQNDPTGVQSGTGSEAAIEGYQVSGKTGTAQQINPETGAYSNSDYWITFAGIAPADDPRYVIAIQLDRPQRGVHGEGGQSTAPLFHDIASWLLDHNNVPVSPPAPGKLILQADS